METERMMKDTVEQKNQKKKILLICVMTVLLIGVVIWAIQVIPVANHYKEERGNAKEFVSNWNARSKESDSLTKGIKISAASGDHTYSLENGVTLKYSINSFWWVKYFSTSVILEFSEDGQEVVFDTSTKLLELFDEIDDKEGMLADAMEKVEVDRSTFISRFSVSKYNGEYSANFIEEKILKSNSAIGYSWNLTMDEWCENFNSNLSLAIEDAAQAGYNWICDTEKELFDAEVDAAVKDELIEEYIKKYPPISTADFRKKEVWTDGTHEFAVYVYRYPNWDEVINQISLFVDDNGYIFDVECLLVQGLFDTINQYAGGDRRNFFMEFYGYPALACVGTGVTYFKALNGLDKFYVDDFATLDLTDEVGVGVAVTKDGVAFICLPNVERNFDSRLSYGEKWSLKSAE